MIQDADATFSRAVMWALHANVDDSQGCYFFVGKTFDLLHYDYGGALFKKYIYIPKGGFCYDAIKEPFLFLQITFQRTVLKRSISFLRVKDILII